MQLQQLERVHNYLSSDCVSTPDQKTRFSPGAASQDSMFNPVVDNPASMTPPRLNPRAPILSFTRRISEEGAGSMSGAPSVGERVSTSGRLLPQVAPLAASHGGGGSRRAVHPILSVRRRQADLGGGMQMQMPLQQAMSSPGQSGPAGSSQFRLSLPSLAPRAASSDQRSTAAQPTDNEQAQHNRLLSMSLSASPTKVQSPSPSSMHAHSKPGAVATPALTPLKPSILNQAQAVPEDSLFLANPFMAQRRTTLTCEPPSAAMPAVKSAAPRKALPVERTKTHEYQEQQQQQQLRPAADPTDDSDIHYELDPEFEAEAAKQRRMSSAFYIKPPAGQEKALDGPVQATIEAAQRLEEGDEYEEEVHTWEPKQSLLEWLDANVGIMKRKGRVA